MKRCNGSCLYLIAWLPLLLPGTAAADATAELAGKILDAAGVRGGLVVHVGCADAALTAALHAGDRYVVHGLDADVENVRNARRYIVSKGLYGRVAVDRFDGRRLPYTDNLVNLLVISRPFWIDPEETMRVLAPGGVAVTVDAQDASVASKRKPWPAEIDQWTHYLHGPDNNAVANDTVVGPPRHMQWLAGPRWMRSHHKLASISSVVTAGGRLFYILDEATAANINVPSKWSLVARDAFSGVKLWERALPSWAWHMIRFRSGPPQVTRLLVASQDRLYAPLGLNAPVSALDPATGKTLDTLEATEGAEEMILVDRTLLVLTGAPVAEQAVGHPLLKDRYAFPNRKKVVAVDAASGRKRWEWSDGDAHPMPETLASDGRRVYLQVARGVVCLDLESGKPLWTAGQPATEAGRRGVTFGRYTLVVSDGVVLCKLGDQLAAMSAENGQVLWKCPAGGGFHSPLDVFVINGLVWQGSHVSDSVSPPPVDDFNVGRDLHTGEIKVTNAVAVDLQTSGHHHRCYREKATCRYILTSKRGIELMDLVGQHHSRNNWVRGTCQYGILPANGLIYAPPHACGCYMEAKLSGFWSLASRRKDEGQRRKDEGRRAKGSDRFEKGPAFGMALDARPATRDDSAEWPQYRHDPLRSGVAGTALPAKLAPSWKTAIGGRLTQPVAAGGKVLLAAIDRHTVHALDAGTGRVLWSFVAGGRVDSPPAVYRGLVLFGSADGYVYCLRASDGALVWRFLAAPEDRRAVVCDQVESLWPVHGSVLLADGVAYCSAGRSTWLDGGIELYGLDPATGDIRYQTHFESRHPRFREGKDQAEPEYQTRVDQNTTDYKTFLQPDRSDAFSMAGGTVSDVLVSDGWNVFLHHVEFDPQLQKQPQMSRHLFSTSSLLDDTESHRSHWALGTGDFSRVPVAYSWIANRPGRRNPTIAVPTGVMLVYDDAAVWGVRRQGDANGRYSLFKKPNAPFSESEEPRPDFRSIPADQRDLSVWKIDWPARPRALLKAGSNLYVGTTPVDIPAEDPHAAYEGRRGGTIRIVAADDGSMLGACPLDAPVVWDGMAAADGRLFVATADGAVRCLAAAR